MAIHFRCPSVDVCLVVSPRLNCQGCGGPVQQWCWPCGSQAVQWLRPCLLHLLTRCRSNFRLPHAHEWLVHRSRYRPLFMSCGRGRMPDTCRIQPIAGKYFGRGSRVRSDGPRSKHHHSTPAAESYDLPLTPESSPEPAPPHDEPKDRWGFARTYAAWSIAASLVENGVSLCGSIVASPSWTVTVSYWSLISVAVCWILQLIRSTWNHVVRPFRLRCVSFFMFLSGRKLWYQAV